MQKSRTIRVHTVADQIVLQLKDNIINGDYHDGDRLPSVQELAAQFGVSISSVREALKKLEALDFVEIIHGRGVFVRSPQMNWQARFTSFSETVQQQGKVPGARLLSSGTCPAPAQVAAQLGMSEGSPVYTLRRLRLADGQPVAIEDSYLPASRFPNLLEKYRDPMSLYHLMQTEYGIRPESGLQILQAVLVQAEESALLHVDQGSPGLLVNTIAYDAEGLPVEYGTSLFRADQYRYVVRLSR